MPALVLPLAEIAAHLPARGVLIGIDLGTKTIGVASSDPDRRLATGVETIARRTFTNDAARLIALANVAAGGYGGAIHAGLFLEEFVAGVPWAHLDIAGVGFTDRDIPNAPRGGVGFGVRLLARWIRSASAD